MIQCITFDLDDTLWDVRPALQKAEQAQNAWLDEHYPAARAGLSEEAILALKKAVLAEQPALRHQISLFRKRFLARLLIDAGIPEAEASGAAEVAFSAFIARRNEVEVFPHSDAVLDTLGQHYILGALTNGNADVFKTPLGRHFRFSLQAEQVGAAKPEPALFDRARELTSLAPHQVLHVGDSHDHDVLGAHRAGISCIWLSTAGEESEFAAAVIGCLSELPNAVLALQAKRYGVP